MKTVIAVVIVFFATIDWSAKGSSNPTNAELEFEQAASTYRGAVTSLASEIAIGRSKDHFIAAQQEHLKILRDSTLLILHEKKKK